MVQTYGFARPISFSLFFFFRFSSIDGFSFFIDQTYLDLTRAIFVFVQIFSTPTQTEKPRWNIYSKNKTYLQ